MFKFLALIMMFVSALLVATSAFACMGPPLHTQTYLEEVPVADEKEAVGKIKILSAVLDDDMRRVLSIVQVVEAVKGLTKDHVFIVISEGNHTCNQDPELVIGSEHYIAGKFDDQHHFHGIKKGEW